MHRTQVGYACLPSGAQALISPIHVAEMRLAAAFGDDFTIDDRRLTGDSAPGTIRVPFERAFVRVPTVWISILIEVRESIQFRVTIGVILVHHVNLDFSELARELHLAIGRQLLRREYQHLVMQPRAIDRAERFFGDAVGQAYA